MIRFYLIVCINSAIHVKPRRISFLVSPTRTYMKIQFVQEFLVKTFMETKYGYFCSHLQEILTLTYQINI